MKIVIVSGGGGHFLPALAFIETLPKNINYLVIGRKYSFEGENAVSLEYRTAKAKKMPFKTITTGRLQRRWTRYSLLSFLKLPIGFFQSIYILFIYKPAIVLSFGGYVSLPVVIAAFLLRIPIVIHEQTLGAGMANKIASLFAAKVCVSWEQSLSYFSSRKTILTGNPMRKEIIERSENRRGKKIKTNNFPVLYVTGGSLGSHTINLLIAGCLENLLGEFVVIHQTGDSQKYKDYDLLKTLRRKLNPAYAKRYYLEKFISPSKVGEVLAMSDIVVSRAGMNTIMEIMFYGKPALLIPLRWSQNNEQTQNAYLLKKIGLAEVISEETANADILFREIKLMHKKINSYLKNSKSAKALIQKEAARKILDTVLLVSKKNNL